MDQLSARAGKIKAAAPQCLVPGVCGLTGGFRRSGTSPRPRTRTRCAFVRFRTHGSASDPWRARGNARISRQVIVRSTPRATSACIASVRSPCGLTNTRAVAGAGVIAVVRFAPRARGTARAAAQTVESRHVSSMASASSEEALLDEHRAGGERREVARERVAERDGRLQRRSRDSQSACRRSKSIRCGTRFGPVFSMRTEFAPVSRARIAGGKSASPR